MDGSEFKLLDLVSASDWMYHKDGNQFIWELISYCAEQSGKHLAWNNVDLPQVCLQKDQTRESHLQGLRKVRRGNRFVGFAESWISDSFTTTSILGHFRITSLPSKKPRNKRKAGRTDKLIDVHNNANPTSLPLPPPSFLPLNFLQLRFFNSFLVSFETDLRQVYE